MPWTDTDYPSAFKNLPEGIRAKAIQIANAVLRDCVADGGDEKTCAARAIRVALAAIKGKQEGGKMTQKRILAEPTRLSRILENFNRNVRGVDIAVDQVHDPDRGAAGWVRELKLGPSTSNPGKQALFARVEWTPLGKELVGGGIFKYISAEFGEHTDPESNLTFPDVLYAVTLTNRPFIKGMKPVSLDDEWVEILREGDYMHEYYGEIAIQAEEEPRGFLRRLYEALRGLFAAEGVEEMAEWTTAYINDLPDASFAVIEPAYERGETKDKRCRHLPHHGPGGGGTQNRNLDLPHLRNAFARVNLIEPVTDSISTEELRRRAAAHLEKHRSALITEQEERMQEQLLALLAELGIEPAEGTDPIAALRGYIAQQKEEVAKLAKTDQAITMAEENTKKLSAEIAALKAQLAAKDKAIFFDEMLRQGKLIPAEREYFELLYDKDPETVKKLLTERKPVVDFEERGTASDKGADVNQKRLLKMQELMNAGMTAGDAYVAACKEYPES